MFNEAFWFFYMLGVFGQLPALLFCSAAAVMLGLLVWRISLSDYYTHDGELGRKNDSLSGYWYKISGWREIARYWKWFRRGLCLSTILVVLAIFVPTQESLYAGAGQYAVEVTGTDDTLMQLKELIDQKIEEAKDE